HLDIITATTRWRRVGMDRGIRAGAVEQILRLRKINPVIMAGDVPRPAHPDIEIMDGGRAQFGGSGFDLGRHIGQHPNELGEGRRIKRSAYSGRSSLRLTPSSFSL